MMKVKAVIIVHLIDGAAPPLQRMMMMIILMMMMMMMRGVESMQGYKKADISPLSGSPISDRPPPYCLLQADNVSDVSQNSFDSVNLAKPCDQNYWQFYRALQSSLTGTTANMSSNQNVLAGLLDVGGSASKRQQPEGQGAAPAPAPAEEEYVPLAYVPPLDGIRYSRRNAPSDWNNRYSMTFVPFDIELVSLKQVDPLGSSFTVQWKMLMQWEVLFTNQTYPKTTINESCSFPCDSTKLNHMCCDNVWVPPLHIPQCNIDSIDSMVDTTPPLFWNSKNKSSHANTYKHCLKKQATCYHRRLWSLNIQTTCDTQMSFHNFPFDKQELSMDIYNPYSSRTWLQFVKQTLHYNGGNIVNRDPPLDENVPSWHITRVAVSIKCGLPSWRQTFLTQNSLLIDLLSNYTSQDSNITEALESLECAETYKDLEVPASANPSNFSVFDKTLSDYKERFANTARAYVQCVNETGTDYTHFSPDGPSQYLDDKDLLTLFGSWLNINHSTKIAFVCLIQATANLTTPIITMTITLQRYRSFYMVKLFLPAILCGVFTFAVAAMPPKLMDRLQIIVPSTLALTALQITITATDVPAVSYMIPTSYLVIATYTIQVLVTLETIAISRYWYENSNAKKNKRYRRNKRHQENEPITQSKEGQSTLAIMVADACETVVEREKALSWWRWCLAYGLSKLHCKTTIASDDPTHIKTKTTLVSDDQRNIKIKRLDRVLLFLLAVFYSSILFLCLLVPMHFGNKNHSKELRGITIYSPT